MLSVSCTRRPISAGSPFTNTQPRLIQSSASRREHSPISAMRLLRRMPAAAASAACTFCASDRAGAAGLNEGANGVADASARLRGGPPRVAFPASWPDSLRHTLRGALCVLSTCRGCASRCGRRATVLRPLRSWAAASGRLAASLRGTLAFGCAGRGVAPASRSTRRAGAPSDGADVLDAFLLMLHPVRGGWCAWPPRRHRQCAPPAGAAPRRRW